MFIRKRNLICRILWDSYRSPQIGRVFTIQKEDWQLVIKESLPVAHTWYRKRKDTSGECSWLPLFWACRTPLGVDRVCSKADQAFTSLGIVSNLPAARLDLWGLVVMGYSNGAWSRILLSRDGGFNATLLCKHFILSVSQSNVNAPIIGHLEPREHPAEDHEPLGMDETRYLLDHGHSFSTDNVSIGWPLNGDSDPPPLELAVGQWDKMLRKVVLDYFQVCKLKEKFHHGVTKYFEEWASFTAKVRCNLDGAMNSKADPRPELAADHPAKVSEPYAGGNSPHIRLDDTIFQELESRREFRCKIARLSKVPARKQKLCDTELPDSMKEIIDDLHKLIDKQLWRLKLLFYNDDIILVDNLHRGDVLYFFKIDGELVEMLTHCHLADDYMDHSPAGVAAKGDLKKLLNLHNVVMARVRMLNFCERIDLCLSVRNTGYNILLA